MLFWIRHFSPHNIKVVKHLLGHVHRRIACIAGPEHNADSQQRLARYIESLRRYNVEIEDDLIRCGDFRHNSGLAHTMALMRRSTPPTAIFCANDGMEIGALTALRTLGIDVPGKVAVAGFDDTELSAFTSPPLTTARLPIFEIGKRAAEILYSRLQGKKRPGQKPIEEVFSSTLQIRRSCRIFIRELTRMSANKHSR